MSMTRRQLVIRSGAVAAWAAVGGVALADRMGAFDEPPPFDRAAFPEPGRSAVAVLRAETVHRRPRGSGVRRAPARRGGRARTRRSCSSRTSSSSSTARW